MTFRTGFAHHARKIVKVGRSLAVIIPPHVLDHLGAEKGDYLVWDLNVKRFAVLSLANVPPYADEQSPHFQPPEGEQMSL